ncbi:MAG: hypothetical protein AB1465_02300 [Patescibacteria group bacterium]
MSIPINLPQKPKNEKIEKIKKFFKKHQERIILTLGAILIAALAFLAGRLSTKPSSINFDKKSLKGQVEIPIKKEIQEQREKSLNIDENTNKTIEDAENTEE